MFVYVPACVYGCVRTFVRSCAFVRSVCVRVCMCACV